MIHSFGASITMRMWYDMVAIGASTMEPMVIIKESNGINDGFHCYYGICHAQNDGQYGYTSPCICLCHHLQWPYVTNPWIDPKELAEMQKMQANLMKGKIGAAASPPAIAPKK
jgi:hypothetical protein